MCWVAEQGFDSDARAPSVARQFASSALLQLVSPEGDCPPIDDAELVISELVTNSVRSGAGTVHLAVRLHHGALEVDVADDGPGWPRLVRAGERDTNGRGLVLVDALAQHWQAERIDSGGKRVRVTIAVPADFTRSLECDRPRSAGIDRG